MKTETTAMRLKQIMSERNLKQVDILKLCQPYCEKYNIKLGKSDLSQFINGKVEPGQWKLTILGLALNVSESWLMGFDVPMERVTNDPTPLASNIVPFPEMVEIPLIGKIACGTPILAQENIQGTVSGPKEMRASFSLICQGDSMVDAGIYDGDIVYIRSQPEVENGEIAAVLIGDEATLKQVYITSDTLLLVPANRKYETIELKKEEMNSARILGKYIGLTRFAEK